MLIKAVLISWHNPVNRYNDKATWLTYNCNDVVGIYLVRDAYYDANICHLFFIFY
jgi:hypothetical protein